MLEENRSAVPNTYVHGESPAVVATLNEVWISRTFPVVRTT